VLNAKPYYNRFIEAMDDDFNTPQGIAALFDLARDINRAEESGMDAGRARETLKELGGVLGLTFKAPETAPLDAAPLEQLLHAMADRLTAAGLAVEIPASVPDANSAVDLLIGMRRKLREAKKFQIADELRLKLSELGIVLEDTPQGTVWKSKR
jgi:cysteinyl-tRNA synthetase